MQIKLNDSIEVDSLRLRIPLSRVEDCKIQDILNPHIEVSELTGEVGKVKNKGHRIRISDTSVIHVDIKKVKDSANKPPIECLIILINSKHLGANYFQGITKNNLDTIYNELQASGLFKFSRETFLLSRCTDVDLKFDQYLTRAERIELVKSFYQSVLPKRTDSVKAFIPRTENNNEVGLQFNYRERATNAKPFVKIYSKGAEAIAKDTQSVDNGETPFFDTYFNVKDLENICRIECTVKGNSMAKAIGIKSMRLGDIMFWTDEVKKVIFQHMLGKYMTIEMLKANAKPKQTKITPAEIMYFKLLVIAIEGTDAPVEVIIGSVVKDIDSKVSRSRARAKLQKIYDEHIKDTEHDQEDAIKKVGQFLARFGLV